MKTIQIQVTDELHAAVKMTAASKKISMREFIEHLLVIATYEYYDFNVKNLVVKDKPWQHENETNEKNQNRTQNGET